MKVVIANSFWKSLETMHRHDSWWYKTYEVFRYKLPMFFENIWYFRKQLWSFRSWDYSFNLQIFSRSLEKTVHTLEFHGHEVDISRMKKVQKIKRVIEIINSMREDVYIDRAEKELGELKNLDGWRMDRDDTPEEKEHNRNVFELAKKMEKSEHNELWDILRGQNHQEYVDLMNTLSDEDKEKRDVWNEWFDGSGVKHWWD